MNTTVTRYFSIVVLACTTISPSIAGGTAVELSIDLEQGERAAYHVEASYEQLSTAVNFVGDRFTANARLELEAVSLDLDVNASDTQVAIEIRRSVGRYSVILGIDGWKAVALGLRFGPITLGAIVARGGRLSASFALTIGND